jgi:ubiquinone/menaquinone biosynthesis C-methylase UbiE
MYPLANATIPSRKRHVTPKDATSAYQRTSAVAPEADGAMNVETPILPEPERTFRVALERYYVAHGFSRQFALFEALIDAMGPQTYLAGERIARELLSAGALAGKRVLDVGCGFGGSLVSLGARGASCVGIDPSHDELQMCRERLRLHGVNARLVVGSGHDLPFPNASFDIVICTEVLEHIQQRERLVADMARVLAPGGLAYAAFPNLLSVRNALKDPHYHLSGVTLMPLLLADRYTRMRRGRPYEVEVLPVAWWIARMFARHGVDVHELNTSEAVLLAKLETPSSIRAAAGRLLVSTLVRLGLKPVLRFLVRLRATLLPSAVLMGFKHTS